MNSKLPHIKTNIFTKMSKLASDYNAINLSQGFPNFPIDDNLVDVLKEKSNKNIHQYMPMSGDPELLYKISALIKSTYKRTVNPETEVLITAGATQGIFTTILALINKNEEVIILDPSYDCYEPAVSLAGGKAKRLPLNDDFSPNWELIKKSINHSTRMLIINSPHNPSGRIWEEQDILCLEKLMMKNPNLLLLSDEVYEHITYDKKHISINTISSIINRSIIISSFGKTFHVTGWKVGYLVGPKTLIEEIKKVHQFNVFSVNSVAQASINSYVDLFNFSSIKPFFKKKRDLFQNLMKKSNFKLLPCEGTYFQLVDYSNISSLNDIKFCEKLTIDYGVAAIPISVFNESNNDNKIIRFCFAKDDETLINATNLLCKI
ncbi:MAG: methionine aminotransferase [Crocinitomicaceae bacterium]|nr:methionine aminotransferase [Crocinitomicaceae bacterium]